MLSKSDLTKASFAQDMSNFISVFDILNSFESFKIFKISNATGSFNWWILAAFTKWISNIRINKNFELIKIFWLYNNFFVVFFIISDILIWVNGNLKFHESLLFNNNFFIIWFFIWNVYILIDKNFKFIKRLLLNRYWFIVWIIIANFCILINRDLKFIQILLFYNNLFFLLFLKFRILFVSCIGIYIIYECFHVVFLVFNGWILFWWSIWILNWWGCKMLRLLFGNLCLIINTWFLSSMLGVRVGRIIIYKVENILCVIRYRWPSDRCGCIPSLMSTITVPIQWRCFI